MSLISDVPIVSVDLETGGLVAGRHTPLSIGAVRQPRSQDFSSDGRCIVNSDNSFYVQLEWDTVVVDPKAMRINRLDIANPAGPNADFMNRSLPAAEGLNLFHSWLLEYSSEPIYALGMNVGSFDLQMLKSVWNYGLNKNWPFHYRSIDINCLFFALSQLHNRPYDVIKQEITVAAREKSGFSKNMEHHALADAWSNFYVWEECMSRLHGDREVKC
jgi:hypothetical protein